MFFDLTKTVRQHANRQRTTDRAKRMEIRDWSHRRPTIGLAIYFEYSKARRFKATFTAGFF